jgi:ectoine hydroxylase
MSVIEDVYPSRVDDQERMIPREDPVVFGSDFKGPLNEDQLSFYDQNGFLILEGLMSDVVDDLLAEIAVLKDNAAGTDELILEPDSDVVRSVFSPESFSEKYAEIAKDGRLLGAAQQILNSQAYIHHSRINIKAAFDGKSFPWHSDFETWHVEDGVPRMRILTGWIFLTENTEFNGSLFVIPKSHKTYVACAGMTPENNFKESLRKQTYGVPSQSAMQKLTDDGGMVGVYGPPGTVVFHEGNLMHGSSDNMSAYPRTNLFFVYNSTENLPIEPFGGQAPRPDFLARKDYTPLKVN